MPHRIVEPRVRRMKQDIQLVGWAVALFGDDQLIGNDILVPTSRLVPV